MERKQSPTPTNFLRRILIWLFGGFLWLLLGIFVLISLPVYIYRFLLSKLVSKYIHPHGRQIVTFGGSGIATDFIPGNLESSSRDSVVVNMILEGTVPVEEVKRKVKVGWLSKTNKHGDLLYPEFQQYIEYWMGFMFWKQDDNFQMEDHLKYHTLEENASDEDSEKFVCNLVEILLNQKFIPQKSPWEINILHNYQNSLLHNGPMTILLIRLHHSMADAASFITVVAEGLFGTQVEALQLAVQNSPNCSTHSMGVTGNISKLFRFLPKVAKLIYDFGFLVSLYWNKSNLLVPDHEKTNWQFYARSGLIPTSRIKNIKNHFGTSFTAVLMSSVSAGLANFLKSTETNVPDSLVVGIPIPLRVKSEKLGINSTATVIELPVCEKLDSIDRLMKCQHLLESSIKSTIPIIVEIIQYTCLTQLSPITRYLYLNRLFPVYLTSFPGPATDVQWEGKHKLVGGDYAVGGLIGNAGIGIIILSTKDNLRIAVTSEGAVMTRDEITQLINCIELEVEKLYNYSIEVLKKA